MVEAGDTAPDFTLVGVDGEDMHQYSLAECVSEGPVVLSFYVFDFSPDCTDQMCSIDDVGLLEFEEDLTVLGISPDGPYSHMAFADANDIAYPLLCDTAQEVAEAYGVLNEEQEGFKRVVQRSLFLVGGDGRVHYRWVADHNRDDWTVEPVEDLKAELDTLR